MNCQRPILDKITSSFSRYCIMSNMGLMFRPVGSFFLPGTFLLFFIAGNLCGCTTFRYLDGSSENEVKEFRLSPSARITALRNEIKNLRGKIEDRDTQISMMSDRLQAITGQTDEIEALKEEIERIEDEKEAMEEKIAALEERLASGGPAVVAKIKVLTGTGRLISAKKMSAKLKGMGYKVERVDYAPRSDFLKNTVYYAPDFSEEAARLAEALGSGAVCKPLTWQSVFDIIVVAGRDT